MSTKRIQIVGGFPQADFNQTDETKSDYIKNKPTLGALSVKDEVLKTDLAADIQESLNKADSAIQSIEGLATEQYVVQHSVAMDAHTDIRLLIEGLTTRLNTLADSDDATLDQMSEVVEYIKSNKNLIECITTDKVNVTDIVNNLVTNVANQPLSAAQGVALKSLIDAIAVPTKVSELTNDKGYLTEHQSLAGYAKVVDLGDLATKDTVDKTDLTSSVQTSLGKADTAVQSSELITAINTALARAKESGEFDGYTPIRGTDYWTDADKAEIKAYVDDAILNGAW